MIRLKHWPHEFLHKSIFYTLQSYDAMLLATGPLFYWAKSAQPVGLFAKRLASAYQGGNMQEKIKKRRNL